MNPLHTIAGVLLGVIGTVAVVTGEFNAAGSWLFAGALALVGLAGLVAQTGLSSRP